jgi:hypothetical protein
MAAIAQRTIIETIDENGKSMSRTTTRIGWLLVLGSPQCGQE